jgi:hypothetical protein
LSFKPNVIPILIVLGLLTCLFFFFLDFAAMFFCKLVN